MESPFGGKGWIAPFGLMALDRGAAERLHRALMVADLEERNRIRLSSPNPSRRYRGDSAVTNWKRWLAEPLADIGAHGWSHRLLAELSIEDQRQEVMWSIRMLSALTGAAVQFFAYPFGGPVTTATGQCSPGSRDSRGLYSGRCCSHIGLRPVGDTQVGCQRLGRRRVRGKIEVTPGWIVRSGSLQSFPLSTRATLSLRSSATWLKMASMFI